MSRAVGAGPAGPAAAGPLFSQPISEEMPFCLILAPRLLY